MNNVNDANSRDTRSRNRRHKSIFWRRKFLAPIFGAGFSYRMRLGWKCLVPKMNASLYRLFCPALCIALDIRLGLGSFSGCAIRSSLGAPFVRYHNPKGCLCHGRVAQWPVQLCWTDNINFDLWTMFIMYFCAVFLIHVHDATFWLIGAGIWYTRRI